VCDRLGLPQSERCASVALQGVPEKQLLKSQAQILLILWSFTVVLVLVKHILRKQSEMK